MHYQFSLLDPLQLISDWFLEMYCLVHDGFFAPPPFFFSFSYSYHSNMFTSGTLSVILLIVACICARIFSQNIQHLSIYGFT